MKNRLLAILLLSGATMTLTIHQAEAQEGCSNATLKGTYRYFYSGHKNATLTNTVPPNDVLVGSLPYIEIGFVVFDGKGHLNSSFVDSFYKTEHQSSVLYHVDSNCQGYITDAGNNSREGIFVSPSGEQYSLIDLQQYLEAHEDLAGTAHRASAKYVLPMSDNAPAPHLCSTATLKGTYRYTARGRKNHNGFVDSYAETGFEDFDGKGHVTNAFHNS